MLLFCMMPRCCTNSSHPCAELICLLKLPQDFIDSYRQPNDVDAEVLVLVLLDDLVYLLSWCLACKFRNTNLDFECFPAVLIDQLEDGGDDHIREHGNLAFKRLSHVPAKCVYIAGQDRFPA